jgi:hypothetical protein
LPSGSKLLPDLAPITLIDTDCRCRFYICCYQVYLRMLASYEPCLHLKQNQGYLGLYTFHTTVCTVRYMEVHEIFHKELYLSNTILSPMDS